MSNSESTTQETISQHVDGRFLHQLLTDDLSAPPTQAELTAALGDPADSPGMIALYDDNAADTAVYLIASSGQSWYYLALTIAA